MKSKYEDIQVDPRNVRSMLRGIRRTIPAEANAALGTPITLEEPHAAVKQGKKLKAPGYDGICHEFFQETWHFTKYDLLNAINQMYMGDLILSSQTHGVMLYVPKIKRLTTPDDYRPLTLLNMDLKLLSRIIANRLRSWLDDTLRPSQHCGVGKNNILDAVAAIRETVAEVEWTNTPAFILTLDLKEAFDRIAHSYLYAALERYGFSTWFQRCIRHIYESATFSVQVNGHVSVPIPLKCSIRQGSPLSIFLFTLCLDPLLRKLDEDLNEHRPARSSRRPAVVAYADDITVILISQRDIRVVQAAVNQYEAATGAMLNLSKTKAMALGTWDIITPIMGTEYHNQIKVLGIHFTNTIRLSAANSWMHVARNIQIPSSRCVLQGTTSAPASTIREHLLTSKGVVHSPNFPAANEQYPANQHSSLLIHMARTKISSANVHALQN
jgi:hypothetical protein